MVKAKTMATHIKSLFSKPNRNLKTPSPINTHVFLAQLVRCRVNSKQ